MEKEDYESGPEFLAMMAQDSLTLQLTRLQSKLNRHAAKVLSAYSLTLLEWRVLYVLTMLKQATLSQINLITEIDRGQLSRTISRLSVKGWVKAKVDQQDLRNRILSLTEIGAAQYAVAEAAMTKRREDLHAVLEPTELQAFKSNLKMLLKHVDQAPEE